MPDLLLFTPDHGFRARLDERLPTWTIGGGEDLDAADECEPAHAAVFSSDWPIEPFRAAIHWLRHGLGVGRILVLDDQIGDSGADAAVTEASLHQALKNPPAPTPPSVQLDGGRAEPARGQIGSAGLSSTESRLLAYLIAHANRAIARSELLEEVWGYRKGVASRTVDTTVRRLRKKIEADHKNPQHIETVQGVGYRFRLPRAEQTSTNLGPATRSFVGRQEELSALQQLVDDGHTLISLVGTGGIGKTALARAFARTGATDWPGGVWFCDLSEVRAAPEVIQVVAGVLDVDRSEEAIALFLAEQPRALVILDNLEQLVSEVADAVARWATSGPSVCLATSREALRLQQEQILRLGPLPTDDDATRQLFLDRARAARPDLHIDEDDPALTDLLEQLEGIPLAIELSAARAGVLSIAQIAGRLADHPSMLQAAARDLPDRHQTLEATLDWSWDLLDPWSRAALAQCAVFRGGFTLEAAEAVVDLSPWAEAPSILDVIQELVDKSLLTAEPVAGQLRFGMYWPIHAFAESRLEDPFAVTTPDGRPLGGETFIEGLFRRHATYFAAMSEGHNERRHQPGGFETAIAETPNLRAVIERMLPRGEGELAGRAYLGLATTLIYLGPLALAVELGQRVLDQELSTWTESFIRYQLGSALRARRDIEGATRSYRRARELAREGGHQDVEVGTGLGLYGIGADDAGDFEDLIERAREACPPVLVAVGLGHQARDHERHGRLSEAVVCFQRAIHEARLADAPGELGAILVNAAECYRRKGDLDETRTLLTEAFPLLHRAQNRRFRGIGMACLGLAQWADEELASASDAMSSAIEVHRQTGFWPNVGLELGFLANIELDRGHLGEAEDALSEAETIAARFPVPLLRITLSGVRARLLSAAGRHEDAVACATSALEEIERVDASLVYQARTVAQLGLCQVATDPDAARQTLDRLDDWLARVEAGERSLAGHLRGQLADALESHQTPPDP